LEFTPSSRVYLVNSSFTIRQVSASTGLSEDTLRYYERIGLIAPSRHASSRHRRYNDDDLLWIDFLVCLRSTGMPLAQIQEYIRLYQEGAHTLPDRRALIEAHEKTVMERIAGLQESLGMIRRKLEFYRVRESVGARADAPKTAKPRVRKGKTS
jgi:DNA-binding transcriptional MerR regulator